MNNHNYSPFSISRIFLTIFSSALFLTCFALSGYSQDKSVSVAVAKDENKIIIRHKLPKFVPLKIELTGLDSADVLRDFEVKITNIGEKPIYSLRYSLQTVDVKISGVPLGLLSFEYGRHELSGGANESEENNVKPTDVPINPNESVTFKLDKDTIKVHKINIETGFIQKPKIYELVFIDLTYADRTGFTKRGFFNQKKTLKNGNLMNYSVSDSFSPSNFFNFSKAYNLSLIPSFLFELKTFDFLQGEQVQQPNAPTCDEACAFSNCERVYEYEINGCPLPEGYPNVPEPHAKVQWVAGTSFCGNNCRNLELKEWQCKTAGYTTREYITSPCQAIPPVEPPEEECEPTGHDEGAPGYEFECTDKDSEGNPIDNDCDVFSTNCQESLCRETAACLDECDADRDGILAKSCGGEDCHPDNPLLPGPKVNGEYVESNCQDGVNDDCDKETDCRDTDCNQSREKCPQCDEDEDGVVTPECNGLDCRPNDPTRPQGEILDGVYKELLCNDGFSNDCDEDIDCADPDCTFASNCRATPTPGGGGGGGGGGDTYYSNYYTEQCDDVYLVTTHYSCFPEEPCQYLYETREYKGSICYTYLE